METMYTNDVSLALDIDELGVRPLEKLLQYPIEEFFSSEKTMDLTVYPAEFQYEKLEKEANMILNDGDDDDDSNNEYDIDPETGR